MTPTTRPRGVSLVEVLTVISVVALLIALVLPAVARSREAARRSRCASNLRQVEAATAIYHETFSQYPTCTWEGGPPSPNRNYASAFGRIAAQLDHVSLFNAINFEVNLQDHASVDQHSPIVRDFRSPANATAMATGLSVLLCPSDPAPVGGFPTVGANARANFGATTSSLDRNRLGPFSERGPASARDVSDGLSHTAAYSEKARSDQARATFDPFADALTAITNPDPPDKSPFESCARQVPTTRNTRNTMGINWLVGGLTQTAYNHLETPNGPRPDCLMLAHATPPARSTARSYHPGGANVAMADGSVRFVASTIGIAPWEAIGSRAGAEVIADAN